MDPLNQGRGVLQFKSALKSAPLVRASVLQKGFVGAKCIYFFNDACSEMSTCVSWITLMSQVLKRRLACNLSRWSKFLMSYIQVLTVTDDILEILKLMQLKCIGHHIDLSKDVGIIYKYHTIYKEREDIANLDAEEQAAWKGQAPDGENLE